MKNVVKLSQVKSNGHNLFACATCGRSLHLNSTIWMDEHEYIFCSKGCLAAFHVHQVSHLKALLGDEANEKES